MRGGVDDNLKIIFLISQQKHHVVITQNRLDKTILMRSHKICFVQNNMANYP